MSIPNPLTVRQIENEISRQAGRRYAIKLEQLDERSLRELLRLLRDLDHEKRNAVRRSQHAPWRQSE